MSSKKISKRAKRFTACLIGCGKIGFLNDFERPGRFPLTHFSALRRSKHFFLTAVAEPDVAVRKRIARKYGVKTYADYREMLAKEKCAVVVIASPDKTHEEILLAAAKHRPRLVFCEKPLAKNLAAVKKIVALYQRQKIGLQVNYSRRFIKEFIALNKQFKTNKKNWPRNLQIFYSRGLQHNGCHYLDLLLWYFGQPLKIIIASSRPGVFKDDPTLSFTLIFKNGLEVGLSGLETSQLTVNEFDFIWSDKRKKIATLGQISDYRLSKHPHYPAHTFFTLAKSGRLSAEQSLTNALDNIYDYLTKGKPLASSGKNSSAVFKLITEIKRNYGRISA